MTIRASSLLAILALLLALGAADEPRRGEEAAPASFIVQVASGDAARAVREVGGTVTGELPIIDAVVARLSGSRVRRLAATAGARIYPDRSVRAAARGVPGGVGAGTATAELVRATALHGQAITGHGVTVAVLDTGVWDHPGLTRDAGGETRVLAAVSFSPESTIRDLNGHGTHVASTIVNSEGAAGRWSGIAPDARLVVIKAFDGEGIGSYSSVVAGIQWAVAHRDRLGIRVLNLSFSAAPLSYYWDDPVAQAAMQAWRAGMVVVTSAGNLGPEAMTVGVPGNVPYLITVGAMSDAVTPAVDVDDYVASFSASGPTVEGFVKPEMVAPGGHVTALMDREGRLAREHPEYHDGVGHFTMSGTSQSAAVVSGVAALLLSAQPWLTPDEVKCRLMDAARPAVDDGGRLAYSVLRQGAGLVDAAAALASTAAGCANRGLDIELDLAGVRHFGGRARLGAAGGITLAGLGSDEPASRLGGGRLRWSAAYRWDGGLGWADAVAWEEGPGQSGFGWGDGNGVSDFGFGWGDGNGPSDFGFGWGDGNGPSESGFGWGDGGVPGEEETPGESTPSELGYGWGDGSGPAQAGFGRGTWDPIESGFGWGDGSARSQLGYGWGDGGVPGEEETPGGSTPSESGYGWGDGNTPSDLGYGWGDEGGRSGYLWSRSPALAINIWVEQE